MSFYDNCIICKVTVSVAGVIKKVSIKYKYNSLLMGCKIFKDFQCKIYIHVHKKLHHSCLDVLTDDQWAHTELHFQACLQKNYPTIHIIIEQGKAQVATYPPHHFAVWLSPLTQHAESLLQKMWRSSHTPVGGITREWFTSLIFCSYGNISSS